MSNVIKETKIIHQMTTSLFYSLLIQVGLCLISFLFSLHLRVIRARSVLYSCTCFMIFKKVLVLLFCIIYIYNAIVFYDLQASSLQTC